MIALQMISKILSTQSLDILRDNLITPDYFVGYEEEIQYILDHEEKYGNVPDKATFLSMFDKIELVEVTESDRYLVDAIREEYLFNKSLKVFNRVAELMNEDANAASEYLMHELPNLQPNYSLGGTNLISQARQRYEEMQKRRNSEDSFFITTGFEELDNLWHGLQRGEELLVILARTNAGKTWVLQRMCTHIWEIGLNVGLFEPEMSDTSIGFRFDTLHSHFSNKGLMWGKDTVDENEYSGYIDDLENRKNVFMVAQPMDFQREVTVSKLRMWVKQYNLDVLAIDGISFLTDERAKRNDSERQMLAHLSEDLMSLSVELGIPVLIVVQANRSGANNNVTESETPSLEAIFGSDGIAQSASKVLALKQTRENSVVTLLMQIQKQRFGPVGDKLQYNWDIDTGEFTPIEIVESEEVETPIKKKPRRDRNVKKQNKKTKEDAF